MSRIVSETEAVTMICPNSKMKNMGCCGDKCHGWEWVDEFNERGKCAWVEKKNGDVVMLSDEQLAVLAELISNNGCRCNETD